MYYFADDIRREINRGQRTGQRGPRNLLLDLPDEFTLEDAQRVRRQQGLDASVRETNPKRSPGLHLQVGAIHVLSFLKLYRQGLYYETSMALVTFCFGSVFGMVTVKIPSSTLAEI